jgi:hypothetical protein
MPAKILWKQPVMNVDFQAQIERLLTDTGIDVQMSMRADLNIRTERKFS